MQYLVIMGCAPCRSTVHEVKWEISVREDLQDETWGTRDQDQQGGDMSRGGKR